MARVTTVLALFLYAALAWAQPATPVQPSKEALELQYVEQAYKACRSDVASLYERLFALQKQLEQAQKTVEEKK